MERQSRTAQGRRGQSGDRGFAFLLHRGTSGNSLNLCLHSHSLVAQLWDSSLRCGQPQSTLGDVTSRGIMRSPTPTFCGGQAFDLIILNQIICVCQKCLFQKGFRALSENIQQHRISHANLFSFRSVCCVLLCWIIEELSVAQYFYSFSPGMYLHNIFTSRLNLFICQLNIFNQFMFLF